MSSGSRPSAPLWQRYLFDFSSRLTNLFPRAGARLLDAALRAAFGNPALVALSKQILKKEIRRCRSFRRFLILPDCHIGDAVMTQSAAAAIRDFFPSAEVDYVVNKTAFPLIQGNPEVTRIMPLFSGGSFLSDTERIGLHRILEEGRYDLCLNFSPFLKRGAIDAGGLGFFDFMIRTPTIVANERRPDRINHFIYQQFAFTREILATVSPPARSEPFRGVRVTLSDAAAERALRFAAESGLAPEDPVVFVNPDGAFRFTRLPFEGQAALLNRIAALGAAVLLGEGHTDAGIGPRLLQTLPSSARPRVHVVPASLPLEAYTALIDRADVFVSGDTGPLHLAAARKFSRTGRFPFRNRTAILSIFGATPARMSGYDSLQPGYLPAFQDAPSLCYTAGSPCRNISCLNKMLKTCPTVRCFEELDSEALAGWVETALMRRRPLAPSRPRTANA